MQEEDRTATLQQGSPEASEYAPDRRVDCPVPTVPSCDDSSKVANSDTAKSETCATGSRDDAGPNAMVSELSSVTAGLTGCALSHEKGTTELAQPPITPLRRTKSQVIREAAFGASDEELSDAEVVPESPRKPRPPTSASIEPKPARLMLKAGRILESDDDIPSSTPSRAPVKKANKKVIILSDDEDEIEEILPSSNISSSVLHRRRSTLVMTPVVEPRKAGFTRDGSLRKSAVGISKDPSETFDVSSREVRIKTGKGGDRLQAKPVSLGLGATPLHTVGEDPGERVGPTSSGDAAGELIDTPLVEAPVELWDESAHQNEVPRKADSKLLSPSFLQVRSHSISRSSEFAASTTAERTQVH